MTSDEHQPQQIVLDFSFVLRCGLRTLSVYGDVEFVHSSRSSRYVNGSILCGRHEPGTRVIGHAGLRPALERCNECLLSEILGELDVARDARHSGFSLLHLRTQPHFVFADFRRRVFTEVFHFENLADLERSIFPGHRVRAAPRPEIPEAVAGNCNSRASPA